MRAYKGRLPQAREKDGWVSTLLRCRVASVLNVCDRYSGSDIAIVVRDALMQPVRKVIGATHFAPVADPDDPNHVKWTPCSSGRRGAMEKSWMEIGSDELQEPPLTMKDFEISLASVRPTVTAADIQRHDQWTRESGMPPRLVTVSNGS